MLECHALVPFSRLTSSSHELEWNLRFTWRFFERLFSLLLFSLLLPCPGDVPFQAMRVKYFCIYQIEVISLHIFMPFTDSLFDDWYYRTLLYTILNYCTLFYTIVHYCTLSYAIVFYRTLSYTLTHYCTQLYPIVHLSYRTLINSFDLGIWYKLG